MFKPIVIFQERLLSIHKLFIEALQSFIDDYQLFFHILKSLIITFKCKKHCLLVILALYLFRHVIF